MKQENLFNLLKSSGLSVAYHHFTNEIQEPPFIIYQNNDSESFYADDLTYELEKRYIVDLVTLIKNPTLESQIEKLFNSNHLPFDKEESYISDERIFQIRYFI